MRTRNLPFLAVLLLLCCLVRLSPAGRDLWAPGEKAGIRLDLSRTRTPGNFLDIHRQWLADMRTAAAAVRYFFEAETAPTSDELFFHPIADTTPTNRVSRFS